jgi:hypothetical protein
MLTGEGAEYFEDHSEDEYDEEDLTPEAPSEYKDLNEQFNDVIRSRKQQIKEKERIIKAQKKRAKPKKRTTKKKEAVS